MTQYEFVVHSSLERDMERHDGNGIGIGGLRIKRG